MTRLAGLILTGVATFTLGAAAPVPPHGQQTYGRGAGLATLTIPQGTDIPVTLDVSVMVKPDQVGNTFPAHITRDLVVEGAVGIPAGAPAEVALLESENGPNAASFRLTRVSIGGRMRPVWTDAARADATAAGPNLGQKAGIGAILGGALGVAVGGGNGLLRGAAAGAGGGLVWGLLDHGSHRVEYDTPLLFTLRAAVRVQ
jgi:hypothetical protein